MNVAAIATFSLLAALGNTNSAGHIEENQVQKQTQTIDLLQNFQVTKVQIEEPGFEQNHPTLIASGSWTEAAK